MTVVAGFMTMAESFAFAWWALEVRHVEVRSIIIPVAVSEVATSSSHPKSSPGRCSASARRALA